MQPVLDLAIYAVIALIASCAFLLGFFDYRRPAPDDQLPMAPRLLRRLLLLRPSAPARSQGDVIAAGVVVAALVALAQFVPIASLIFPERPPSAGVWGQFVAILELTALGGWFIYLKRIYASAPQTRIR